MKKKRELKNQPISFPRLFLHCGIAGWCMEILYTASISLRRRDFKLRGTTSLWMFPIYGCSAFLRPLFKKTEKLPCPVKGSLYALLIFLGEYLSGRFLTKKGCSPWDYSRIRLRIGQHIRLDFFPFWFLAGLFYEKFTLKNGFQKH